jgi:hypothetical protein
MLIRIFLLESVTFVTAVVMSIDSWRFMIGCCLGMVQYIAMGHCQQGLASGEQRRHFCK